MTLIYNSSQEAILEEHQATPSEQATPSRAKAEGKKLEFSYWGVTNSFSL
jgi:hypothetical protein